MRADLAAFARAPLALLLMAGLACPPQRAGAQEPTRRYPPSRAAELKARLLDRPSAPEADAWALEYAEQPEVDRLEPIPRAAEKVWAARLGLAAGSKGGNRKRLQSLLASLESCPLDSLAIRRAGCGLARIGVVVPL